MGRGLLILVAVLATVAATGWTALRLQLDPSLFRRPLYRLTHRVYGWRDMRGAYPSREVAVQLRAAEGPAAAARACAHAFEIRSLDEVQQMTCRIFADETAYHKFLAGHSDCVLAEAVQMPYDFATNAKIAVNRSGLCL